MFSAQALAVVLAAFSTTSAFAADCARQYTVQEGDICDSISAANNVSTYQLAVVNDGHIDSACGNLLPGDSICLGRTGEDCSDTYVVRDNDTCDRIHAAHGLNSTILYLNNPQINEACDNIYIGEVLCVAQSVQVPPAPAGPPPAGTIPATAIPAVPSATKTPTKVPVNTPSTPVVNTPSTPVVNTPSTSVVNTPSVPVVNTPSTSVVNHTPAATHTTAATHTSAAIPTSASIPTSVTIRTSAPIHTSTPQNDSGDNAGGDTGDDEDLPFCDEI